MAKSGSKTQTESAQRDGILFASWFLAIAAILLTVYVRIRLLNVPLERDEGEFAYVGQLILKGVPPYQLAYSMKLPGIYAVYALIMAVFGQTVAGIRIGLLLANLGATTLVFCLARRLWNTQAALLAAASYPVLTLGLAVVGTSAHATQFQMPMVLAGLILLLKSVESDRRGLLVWSGLLMGLALVTKQQAFLFPLFSGFYLIGRLVASSRLGISAKLGRVAIYTAAVIVPVAATYIVMYAAGVFDKFWFWTVTYAHNYVSQTPLALGMRLLLLSGASSACFVWLLLIPAAIGLIGLCCDRKLRENAVLVIGLLVFSFLAVCPGFFFRNHYFVQIMPAVALLIGASSVYLSRLHPKLRLVPLLLFAAGVAHAFATSGHIFFRAAPAEVSRLVYGSSPFPESIEVARYIREHTDSGEKFAVVGSEPQIYFYADRPSATGYIYTYALMEPQPFAITMQDEMISEIEEARPRYLVFAKVFTSWTNRPDSDLSIIDWFARYSAENYKVVGLAEIAPDGSTEYTWGEDAADLAPESAAGLIMFERKPGR